MIHEQTDSFQWTSVRKSQQTIHSPDCSCSRVENSLIQMIRLERVFFSELNSQVNNREILWARARAQARNSCCEKYVTNVEI